MIKKKGNFVVFRAFFFIYYKGSDGGDIERQTKLEFSELCSGTRDHHISDCGCMAWEKAGGTW